MANTHFPAARTQSQQTQATVGSMEGRDRHRLFFALLPDAEARKRISSVVKTLAELHHPLGRWIAAEHFHITLRFLGEESQLFPEWVAGAIAAAKKVRVPGFEVRLDHAMSFPGARPVWVLGSTESAQPLRSLWKGLGDALDSEQMRSDTRSEFVPHVTILRDADRPLAATAIDPIRWPAREFVLMHSEPGRQRRYLELGRWSLANAARQP